MKRPGVSVIEVIVAIGIAAIVIAAIGNLIGATHRLTTASGKEIQAAAYARQWIEIISGQANTVFGCSCGTGVSCGSCTVDGQTCTTRQSAGFNSCWVERAKGLGTPAQYKFVQSGATFALGSADGSPDVPGPGFTRIMMIENQANFDIKKITVSVCWGNNDCTDPTNNRNRTQLSTILTAWENF